VPDDVCRTGSTRVLRISFGFSIATVFMLMLVLVLTAEPAAATAYTSTAGGNWSDSTKWSPPGIPGSGIGDTATILGNTMSMDYATPNALAGFSNSGTLNFTSGGVLSLGTGVHSNTGTLNFSAGQILINGATLTSVPGSTFTIGSNTTLSGASGGTLDCSSCSMVIGGTSLSFNAIILNNTGTITFTTSTNLNMGGGAVINNNSGGIFDVQSNGVFNWSTNPPVAINNASGATFKKTTAGTTTFNGVLLNNNGTVHAQAGTIQIPGGTSSGLFTANLPSTIEFNSETHTTNGATIGGNGVRLNGGTITGTALTIPNTAAMSWTSGTMSGAGTTTIAAGGTLFINGAVTLSQRVIDNFGTVTFLNAGQNFTFGAAAVFNNKPGGVFDAQNSANTQFFWATNPPVAFNNEGIFKKTTTAAGITLFNGVPFNNTGAVQAQSGTIEIETGVSTGTFSANAAIGTVDFKTGIHTMNGAQVLGDGVRINGGTINGTNLIVGNTAVLTWSAGTMSGALTDVTTIQGGGTLKISGAVTLTGRAISNSGLVLFASGGANFNFGGGSTFTNTSTGIFEDQNTVNAQLFWATNPPVNFNNAGLFRKTAGTGATTTLNGVLLNNTGTVNGVAGTIEIEGGTSTGDFTATSPAIVQFRTTSHTMNGAEIFGNGVRLNGGTILGSNLIVTPGAIFTWSSGTMSGATTDTTTNNGTIVVAGAVTQNARTINNNASVIFASAGGAFNMGGGASFNNAPAGTFDDQNTVDSQIFWVTNPPVNFNNAGVVKKTAGPSATLRFANGALINNTGSVNAMVGTIAVRGGTSTGSFIATAPSAVVFDSGTHTMNGGNVSGNGVQVAGGTINGTNFHIPNGATLTWSSGTMTGSALSDVTSNSGTVDITGAVSLNNRTFSNSGLVRFISSGGNLNLGAGAAFINNGSGIFDARNATDTRIFWVTNPPVAFNNAGTFRKTTTGAGRTIFDGVTLNNTGTVESQIGTVEVEGGASTGAFTTTGSGLIAFTTGTHTLNAGTTLNGPGLRLTGATLTGTGVNIMNGATLTWTAGTMSGASQTTTINSGGTIVFNGTGTLNQRTLANNGTFIFAGGTSFNLGAGAIFNNNASGLFDDQNTGNDAIVWATNPPTSFNNAGTFRKSATAGTTTTLNGVVFNNTGVVDAQAGTIRIGAGTSSGNFNTAAGAFIAFFTGTHTLNAGNTFTGAGTIQLAGGALTAPGGVFANGGTLAGTGTITGNVTNNAIIAPGLSPGLITINGNYAQNATGSLNIELGGAGAGSGYDKLTVNGAATLSGTLNVALINSFTPTGGQTFQPLSFTSRTGDFTTKNLPTFSPGGSFTSSYTATALVLTAVVTNADLTLAQSAPPTVAQGSNAVFTINIGNGPSLNATNVVVTNNFSGGAFVSAVPSSGSCTGTGPVTCNLGTVPVNGTATITLTLNANAIGTITNTATVTATEPDGNTANNTATSNVTVNPSSDVSVTKNVVGSVIAGQPVLYAIAVTNNGPSPVTNVAVSDPTPAGLTFIENTGACTTPFPCTIASLASGATATINAKFFVPANASGTVTNTATASDAGDPNTANNSATVASAITQAADIQIVKTGPAQVAPGSEIVYTLAVKNNGPSTAHDVTVTDPTPPGLTLVSVSGACTSFPCNPGTMTAGQTAAITVRYSTPASGGSTVTNTASVTTSTPDPNGSNNSSSATTVLSCNNETPGSMTPENGRTNAPTTGRLSWQPTGATFYSVYLGRVDQGGCTVPFGSAEQSFIDYANLLPNTTYEWKVIAITPGCPDRTTACARFTTGANCNVALNLVRPLGGNVTSPFEFEWQPVAGATEYTVFAKSGSGNFLEAGRTSSTKLIASIATDGPAQWYVVATIPGCGTVQSATASFNLCNRPEIPLARVVGQATSAQTYRVEWDDVPNAIRYEVDEATNPGFTGATTQSTTNNFVQFRHDAVDQPLAFFYRVRAFSACSSLPSESSPAIRIVIIPLARPDSPNLNTNVPAGSTEIVVQRVFIEGVPGVSATYSAVTDRPWLTVRPPTGVLPPEGITLEVLADPRTLPNGTFTATVIVTITTPTVSGITGHGTATASKPVSISLVTPVTPVQNKIAPTGDALIIPSVGHLDGVNSHWQSDIRVTNTGLQAAKYNLTFTPSAGTSTGIKATTINVGPGETTALDDIIKNWFGIGSLGDSANGMLEIRAADAVPFSAVASSRTYNVTDNGTLGQFIPALPFSGFIGRAVSSLSMQQIAQSSAFRTNVGIVEASGKPANGLMSVFNTAGVKLADIPFSLAGGEQRQLNSVLAANNITLNDGRIQVQVTGGDGKVTAYASVVDNATNDPLLVSGVQTNVTGASKYVLPGVADLTNALANWRTDMRVFNASLASQNASLTLHPLGGGAPLNASLTLQPGEVRTLDDVVKTIFGASNIGGAVHVQTATNTNLVVTGRTYNQTSEGTFGQFIEAVTPDEAVGANGRSLHVLQVEDSTRYRTNLGIAEVTGQPVTVEVQIFLPDSKVTPTITFPMAANEFRQLSVIRDQNLGNVYNARLAVRVVSGTGRVTAYGSVIDMLTQDPTYVPGQ
jgi:uncharacterized repeat protein (TIGR01451 family)